MTSTTTIRLLPANASGVVDGSGADHTIFGAAPRDTLRSALISCLTAVMAIDDESIRLSDSCTGKVLELHR